MPEVPQQMPGLQAAGNFAVNRLISGGPKSAKKMMLLIVAGIIVMVAASTAWLVFKRRTGLATSKGNLAYTALGIDMKHGDPDQMIAVLAEPAHRWAHDAVWWSLNLTNINADGTVDLSDGGAVITYISPSRVVDYSPNGRKDSIKDFSFAAPGVLDQAARRDPAHLVRPDRGQDRAHLVRSGDELDARARRWLARHRKGSGAHEDVLDGGRLVDRPAVIG